MKKYVILQLQHYVYGLTLLWIIRYFWNWAVDSFTLVLVFFPSPTIGGISRKILCWESNAWNPYYSSRNALFSPSFMAHVPPRSLWWESAAPRSVNDGVWHRVGGKFKAWLRNCSFIPERPARRLRKVLISEDYVKYLLPNTEYKIFLLKFKFKFKTEPSKFAPSWIDDMSVKGTSRKTSQAFSLRQEFHEKHVRLFVIDVVVTLL